MRDRQKQYYLAMAKMHAATADAYRLDPSYDDDEDARERLVLSYESYARDYLRMADDTFSDAAY